MTSVSLTLPVPGLHEHMVALPPLEALFAGRGAHNSKPGKIPGETYSFVMQPEKE